MAIFERDKLVVISEQDDVDISKASFNKKLSIVNFDDDGKFFYMTIDKALFSDPVSTIRTVLDAHGFVANLENILSCLDSFNFSVHTRVSNKSGSETSAVKVQEYLPCIRFELPQKNRVGETLKSFYDEIAKYESKAKGANNNAWASDPEVKKSKKLKAEIDSLKAENKDLKNDVRALTHQLSVERSSLNRARGLDPQYQLPDNAKIGRIDHVDLKRRKVKVKCNRKVIDIPTHLLDRVPDYRARCLLTFDVDDDIPLGIIFFDNEEIEDLEKRTAELLYVKDNSFKARDSNRNEFQITAVNPIEAETIRSLSRGMKVVISVSDGYVVRFSVLSSKDPDQFKNRVHEQFIVHDIARNQLVAKSLDDSQEV
jgi:hypothetical protein